MAEKTVYEKSLDLHAEHHGKIGVVSKVKVENRDDLSQAYSPGVAEPCRQIAANPSEVYKYTAKRFTNFIANKIYESKSLRSSYMKVKTAILKRD